MMERYERWLVRKREIEKREKQKRERRKNIFLFHVWFALAVVGGVIAYFFSGGGFWWTVAGVVAGWIVLPLVIAFRPRS